MLEPDEGKLSRPVLRGLEASNGLRLLGKLDGNVMKRLGRARDGSGHGDSKSLPT